MEYNYKQGKWKCNKEVRHFTKTHNLWNTITSRGNGSAIKKLEILQKHAIRIINKTNYGCHTDPNFKSENILKITDIYRLHVSLFLHDYQHNTLPNCSNNIPEKKFKSTFIACQSCPECTARASCFVYNVVPMFFV